MKESIKPYSDELYSIFVKATQLSRSSKFYHTWCGTPHLFLALIGFLNSHKNDEDDSRYRVIRDKLVKILNDYNVTGENFKEQFLLSSPLGTQPNAGEQFEVTIDQEFLNIKKNLDYKVMEEKRSMEVEDFILELFTDKSFKLFLILSSIIGSDMKTEEMYDKIIKMFKKIVAPVIEDFKDLPELNNINEFVIKNPQTVIGADKYVNSICMALSGRSIKNAILTGPAGTGKTTYVYELVQRINNENVPKHLQNKIIYQLDTASLIAGTRYRGDFEEKLMNIIEVVKKHPEVILFVDEAHTLVKLGDSEQGANNAGNILKPYITRGEIQMILATTDEEYTKYIADQKAFARRFHEIKINEPTKEETKKILEGLLPVESKYFNKSIQEELLDQIIDLSEKYTLDQANPAKSINMLELACAYSRVFEENEQVVNVDDIIHSVKLKYDIYISSDKLADTETILRKEILGQDDAISQLLRDLKVVDRGVVDKEKPLMSILCCGPTGTGKTASAKIIAKNFFGSDKNLIKINMGEYSSEMDVSKLTGASSGYVGYDDEPELIKQVRQKPNSLVLFDEIEKAHPAVQKVLLNILDEGEMKDNKGNKVSFRNCIIMFTTNLGCNKNTGKMTGMGLIKTKEGGSKTEVMKAIENYFSPEFLGRLDDIIFYNFLPESIITELISRYLKEYKDQDSTLNVEFTDDDIQEIIKNSEIVTRGARGVRKAVRKQIVEVEDREDSKKESSLN